MMPVNRFELSKKLTLVRSPPLPSNHNPNEVEQKTVYPDIALGLGGEMMNSLQFSIRPYFSQI